VNGLSVVLPARDEEKALGSVLDDLDRVLRKRNQEFEIIVVDDGSADKTSEIAAKRNVRLLKHPVSGGYGLSIRDGILEARYNQVVIMDADGTYPADRIPELADALNEFDMVIGARTGKAYRESLIKNPFRKVLQILCEFVVGGKIPDVNSGLRAFKKDVVLRFRDSFCLGFSFTTTITLALHLSGHFIKYIPIEYYRRIGRRPHVRLLRDTLRTLQIVTHAILSYTPIKLYLLLSASALLLAGLAMFLYCLKHSLLFLLVGVAFLIIAAMFVGMGFLAELLRQQKNSLPLK
jgi:glycosyltransferase involved in cell wall biosynthesis